MAKRRHEHVNHERWLVSYADFITLLFAFFVIMYAMSRADAAKFKTATESIRKAFGAGAGASQDGGGGSGAGGGSGTNPELDALSRVLQKNMSFESGIPDAAEKMQIITEDRGLVVRLAAADFFDAGKAEVRAEVLPVLDEIAKILKPVKRHIRIEGHTDNIPTVTPLFPSNWELSTARAAWIVRYLLQKWEFDPRLLEASGYAENHPIADNASEEGRAQNRRIEIVVLEKDSSAPSEKPAQ